MFVDLYPRSRSSPSVIPPSAHPSDLPGGERELELVELDYHFSIKISSSPPSCLAPPLTLISHLVRIIFSELSELYCTVSISCNQNKGH